LPPIPGFPWESIIAGMILGMAALALVRRRKK
jgi:LPXTG-motif cell wall-anchored protein